MSTLPQLERRFLTDGGMETDLLFNHNIDLPCFSSTTLLDDATKKKALHDYYLPYLDTAEEMGLGFILESPSWRASPDWAEPLGLSLAQLADRNRAAIRMMLRLRDEKARSIPVLVSGCIGPRGDGYVADDAMTADDAADYHSWQAQILSDAGADLITALTMTNIAEAIGIARAARRANTPAVISFTVETDGHIPSGETLGEAIAAVDKATDDYPSYYMVNCAHPDHFADTLEASARWVERIKGVRANASRMSHEELDAMEELDDGDPQELGQEHAELVKRLPHLTVLGGCCGTDHRHVEAIARAAYA